MPFPKSSGPENWGHPQNWRFGPKFCIMECGGGYSMGMITCERGQFLPPGFPPLVALGDHDDREHPLVIMHLQLERLSAHVTLDIALSGCVAGTNVGAPSEIEVTEAPLIETVISRLYTHQGPIYIVTDSVVAIRFLNSFSAPRFSAFYLCSAEDSSAIEAELLGAVAVEV